MRYLVNSPSVIAENLHNEYIILNLQSGVYYSALETGAITWQLLSSAYTLTEAAEILSKHYLVPTELIHKDLESFLQKLITDKLITPCAEDTKPITNPSFEMSEQYKTPEINMYNDMENLLLADPIHQVENLGWPNVKKDNDSK